jgi:3-methyladenine DNA glycosylase/8-oxoguanine DNA glycosylase
MERRVRTISIPLQPPAAFDFDTVVESHGWSQLAPFEWDTAAGRLSRPEALPSGAVATALFRPTAPGGPVTLEVTSLASLAVDEREELARRAARILALDMDLREFHDLCRERAGFEGVIEAAKGRLLRSSTLWEDIVKTILTTNVNWSGTRRMVRRLVDTLGTPLPWDLSQRSFPAPAQVLAGSDALAELGLGYRRPYLIDLASRLVDGELDLSQWEDRSVDTETRYRELRRIKGVGDYAASSILMVLGRADRIPVDSWARKMIGERLFGRSDVTDKEIAGAFAEFGRWRGLAYWFYTWDAALIQLPKETPAGDEGQKV